MLDMSYEMSEVFIRLVGTNYFHIKAENEVFTAAVVSTSNDQVNTAEFCEEVQKYECLYNKFNKGWKNKHINANCWRRIGEKFGITPEDAEKKFKNTRTACWSETAIA